MNGGALTIPIGATAQRLEWPVLPRHVRQFIEQHCGSEVVEWESQNSGFAPGFASVLTCQDGSRHFVKAASSKAQRSSALSYRTEATKLAGLPEEVPAPKLLWSLDDDWVVLSTEYVGGRSPFRPWLKRELDLCLDTCEQIAQQPSPVPLASFAHDFSPFLACWDSLLEQSGSVPHIGEAAALARGHAEATAGETLVHTDLRDDNILIDRTGSVWFCDWNWPVAGAAWLDSLLLLVGPRGDGLDVEAIIAERPLLRSVPADHIDAVLALLAGYYLKCGGDKAPSFSPYLRRHQQWCGEVCWDWLAERRGW